jgi:hypothetical protein
MSPGMEELLSGLSVDPAVRALVAPAFGLASTLQTVNRLQLVQPTATKVVKSEHRARGGSSAGGGKVVRVSSLLLLAAMT